MHAKDEHQEILCKCLMHQTCSLPSHLMPACCSAGDQPHEHAADAENSDLDPDSLHKLVRQLRQTVSVREAQLEGQAKEQSRLEDVTHQLMVSTCMSPSWRLAASGVHANLA